jgi:hypothetical protein
MAERVKLEFRDVAPRCFSLARGKQREWRRLITLIFAGRNRMLMIRRELPRTKNAGWASRACRIKRSRVLLIGNTSASISTAFLIGEESRFIRRVTLRSDSSLFRFHLNANGPDKIQQLSPDRGDDLGFVFTACEEFSVAQMQSVLCLPGDFFDFGAQTNLAFEEIATKPRAELIGPGGFHNDPAKMRVAGLRNAALASCGTTGIFTGNQAASTMRC